MLQCVAVCCSVQGASEAPVFVFGHQVCCSVLQCVAVCCSVLQCVEALESQFGDQVYCSVMHYTACLALR